MIDLTVILLPTASSEHHLGRSLSSVLRLMRDSGLSVHCLIAEFLPPGTDVQALHDLRVDALPTCMREVLDLEGFDYVVEYAHSARALRRVVRCARGRYVCLLREGDEIGFRVGADDSLQRDDHDLLLALPAEADASLAAHLALSGLSGSSLKCLPDGSPNALTLPPPDAPTPLRALPALVRLVSAYDGAIVARRDFFDDALSLNPYDGTPAYLTYANEVLTMHALRRSARLGFTQQLACFPHQDHARQHRRRVTDLLPTLQVRRRDEASRRSPAHEVATEALVDTLIGRLANLFSRDPQPDLPLSPFDADPAFRGELTWALDVELRRAVAQVQRGWGWAASGAPVQASGPQRLPRDGTHAGRPDISLICSAFRGQAVVHSFVTDLARQSAWSRCELIIALPEPNLIQDLVFESMALVLPQLRLLHLASDPGIYGCWNLALQMARGAFVSNANLDDRRDIHHLQKLTGWLQASGADVASAAVAISGALADITGFDGQADAAAATGPKEVWYAGPHEPSERGLRDLFAFNANGEVTQCMNFPHCMPVWRRSLHDRLGLFDEPRHGTYADFAFWLRAASAGARFVHSGEVLGLYLVDPQSHNRRNSREDVWHELVRAHLPPGTVVHAPQHVTVSRPLATTALQPPARVVRLNFGNQIAQNYGNHRSGWSYAVQGLKDFDDPTAPIFCNTFIEKRFVWGGDEGDGGVGPVAPHLEPWVGFIHVPPMVPGWFQFEQSNEQIFSKESWRRSEAHCRGLFVLTDYHRRYLQKLLRPKFPISVLHHPTEFPEQTFDLARFEANPTKRLVQIGWWLRKLAAIQRLQVPGYVSTLLGRRDWTKSIISYAERRFHGLCEPGGADVIDFLSNEDYDALLTENLVFIDFYDTSANNAVIECIARATPIVVCRHPAVEEYLESDYPLFYSRYSEIPAMLADRGRIRAAHTHLQQPRVRERLTLEYFRSAFAQSEVVSHAC